MYTLGSRGTHGFEKSPMLPYNSDGKESTFSAGDLGLTPGLGRKRLPTPVFWPGESPWTEELGSLQSIALQRVRESDTTEQLSTHNEKINSGKAK